MTYPRTDARVLSTAVAKEIGRNIGGLKSYGPMADFAQEILSQTTYKGIGKTRYTNDKQIMDHYAIIPTGQGFGGLRAANPLSEKVYQLICRRFLSIFYPPAVYQKYSLDMKRLDEHFFASVKVLKSEGYLKVTGKGNEKGTEKVLEQDTEFLKNLKKGMALELTSMAIKEGETSPPKRYTSGSMILAMENAGQLIEDEELRAQIKGSGIGTSATRAEILKKLVSIKYLALNKKTQVITPTLLGELIFDVVTVSIRQLLNPELTASWEKGLTYVAEGSITSDEYMEKLERFVAGRTYGVMNLQNQYVLRECFDKDAVYYKQLGK